MSLSEKKSPQSNSILLKRTILGWYWGSLRLRDAHSCIDPCCTLICHVFEWSHVKSTCISFLDFALGFPSLMPCVHKSCSHKSKPPLKQKIKNDFAFWSNSFKVYLNFWGMVILLFIFWGVHCPPKRVLVSHPEWVHPSPYPKRFSNWNLQVDF